MTSSLTKIRRKFKLLYACTNLQTFKHRASITPTFLYATINIHIELSNAKKLLEALKKKPAVKAILTTELRKWGDKFR